MRAGGRWPGLARVRGRADYVGRARGRARARGDFVGRARGRARARGLAAAGIAAFLLVSGAAAFGLAHAGGRPRAEGAPPPALALAPAPAPGVGAGEGSPAPARGGGAGVGPQDDNVPYSGRYTLTRIRYTLGPGARLQYDDGRMLPEWAHDYPRGERHLAKILSELTAIEPVLDGSNIFMADDPDLTRFPIVYMCELGYWRPTEEEVEGMRSYLLKGGFVIFDDFRGRDWENFRVQIDRVLPGSRLVELDGSHPIFHSFFDIDPAGFAAPTFQRYRPVFYGLYADADTTKPLVAIVNYNNDISEYWEWSDTGFAPIDLSNEAYKLGINYIMYAMTH